MAQLPDQLIYHASHAYSTAIDCLNQPYAIRGLVILGSVTVLYLVNSLIWALWLFLRPSSLPRSLHPSRQPYLTYALVTGASDGIGREICFELTRRGFALAIHGRNPAKLNAMADELQAHFKAQGAPRPLVLVAQADKCSSINFTELVKPLQKLRLTMLINNVGGQGHLSHDPYHTLVNYSPEDIDRLVDLNAKFMIMLTRELLPLLLRSTDKTLGDDVFTYPVPLKRSDPGKAPAAHIINASSLSALGVPYVLPYCASKGLVETFTKALRNEFRAEGYPASRIDVVCWRIGNVVTGTNPNEITYFVPAAKQYARAVLNRVGCDHAVVVPYFPHWLQVVFFVALAPQSIQDWSLVMNMQWQVKAQDKIRAEWREQEKKGL